MTKRKMNPIDQMTMMLEFLQGVAELMDPDIEITHAGRRALGWMLGEFVHDITTGIKVLQQEQEGTR